MTIRVSGKALFGALSLNLPRCAKPEERLTAKCADFLRLAAPADLFFCHVPNEGVRHAVGHAIQEAMGRVMGMTDLHLLFRGCPFYVEIKVKGKKSTPKPTIEQVDCMRRIVLAGGQVAVVDNIEDFITQMRAWGIVL